jgi:hypothetical protein
MRILKSKHNLACKPADKENRLLLNESSFLKHFKRTDEEEISRDTWVKHFITSTKLAETRATGLMNVLAWLSLQLIPLNCFILLSSMGLLSWKALSRTAVNPLQENRAKCQRLPEVRRGHQKTWFIRPRVMAHPRSATSISMNQKEHLLLP